MVSAVARRLAGPVRRILAVQQADGAIPWFEDGPWDAWNHAECVMALGCAGEHDAAWAGLEALAERQQPDGAFLGEYGNALPMTADLQRIARVATTPVRDTNFTAYVATAALHRALLGDARTGALWPMVRAAIDHVVTCQHPDGDVSWCAEAHGTAIDDALVTANASIYSSIGHAVVLAERVGEPQPRWSAARARLGDALRNAPHRFGRIPADRAAHAMDWYYPVLAGVHDARSARALLHAGWPRFVDATLGCHCVDGEPWVTVAESCELAIAAWHVGLTDMARDLLRAVEARRTDDGAFWMGWQSALAIHWPVEQPSWTQAAYVLAVDAIEAISPAAGLFARASRPIEVTAAANMVCSLSVRR